jgi:hypothetical protein
MKTTLERGVAGPTLGSLLLVVAWGAAAVLLVRCGAGTPTVTPTPIVTPTPVPTPTPDPNIPPAGSGCGKPYPPPITRFKIGVMYKLPEYTIVDSTPLVGPDVKYCVSAGFTDGRSICPVRLEGTSDREACEVWRSGTAKDTGKPGPTWTWTAFGTSNTAYCSGGADKPCDRLGPFQVKAFKGGTYEVCTEAGACGEVAVER